MPACALLGCGVCTHTACMGRDVHVAGQVCDCFWERGGRRQPSTDSAGPSPCMCALCMPAHARPSSEFCAGQPPPRCCLRSGKNTLLLHLQQLSPVLDVPSQLSLVHLTYVSTHRVIFDNLDRSIDGVHSRLGADGACPQNLSLPACHANPAMLPAPLVRPSKPDHSLARYPLIHFICSQVSALRPCAPHRPQQLPKSTAVARGILPFRPLRTCSHSTIVQADQKDGGKSLEGGWTGRKIAGNLGVIAAYAVLIYYVVKISPNQTPMRDSYFIEKLANLGEDDGVAMNTVLVSVFNLMGIYPIIYSALLIPSARSKNNVRSHAA